MNLIADDLQALKTTISPLHFSISDKKCHVTWLFFRFAVLRQPRGPDGSTGFNLDRGDMIRGHTAIISEEEMQQQQNEEQVAALTINEDQKS